MTYEWIRTLHERTGGPVVEVARYDFTDKIAHKPGTVRVTLEEVGG